MVEYKHVFREKERSWTKNENSIIKEIGVMYLFDRQFKTIVM